MMASLLRADLHRALHSRWPWVALAVIAAPTLGSAVLTIWLPLSPGLVFDGLTGPAGALRLGGRGSGVELVLTVGALVAAHLSCEDVEGGFERTLLASLRGRAAVFSERCLFVALTTAAMLLAYLALGTLGSLLVGVPAAGVESAWEVAAWAGLTWLVGCAYALAALVVGHLTRRRALAYGMALILVSAALEQGILATLVLAADGVLGLGWAPALEAAATWMPYAAASSVAQGAQALLAVDAVGTTPAVRALVSCGAACVAAVAVDVLLASRRDVA